MGFDAICGLSLFQNVDVHYLCVAVVFSDNPHIVILQVFDKNLAKKFDELIVSLLLRMYDPPSEGSDISQFTKLVSFILAMVVPPKFLYFDFFLLGHFFTYTAALIDYQSSLRMITKLMTFRRLLGARIFG